MKVLPVIFFCLIYVLSGCGGGGGGAPSTNISRVAEAGADQVVAQGSEAILDGSASKNQNGQIVSYQWVQTQGTPVSLTGANTVSASFLASEISVRENLDFRLTVQDNAGAQSSDVVRITVNIKPVADAGPDQTVTLSSPDTRTITLTGTSSQTIFFHHYWQYL